MFPCISDAEDSPESKEQVGGGISKYIFIPLSSHFCLFCYLQAAS